MPTPTYTAIATQTLTASAATMVFSSIPQTYTDLVIVCNLINGTTMGMQVGNGTVDTGASSYTAVPMSYGTAVNTNTYTQSYAVIGMPWVGGEWNEASTYVINIGNYTNTNGFKPMTCRSNSAGNRESVATGASWKSTSAINIISLNFDNVTSLMSTYSTATLYGIKGS